MPPKGIRVVTELTKKNGPMFRSKHRAMSASSKRRSYYESE